ncbi:MAG: hypothetical protein WA635_10820 [Gallionella sp.]
MKYITTTGSPPGFLALLVGAMLLGLVSQSALAAGTASGTVISNLAKISYDVGGTPQGDICSSPTGNGIADDDGVCVSGAFGALVTSFAVDNKVDLLVTEGNTTYTTVAAGQLNALTIFTVENQGNTTQDFSLAVANLANGTVLFTLTDDFNPTGCTVDSIAISSGSMGAYTAGDQHINALTADSIATISVSCDIPAAQANNSFAVVSLTATARADDAANTLGAALAETANTQNGTEIVFGDSAGTDDALGDAAHSARDAYLVQTATLTVTKAMATLCDPVDGNTGPHNIPGGMVRWTITIANTGGASAKLTTFSDAVPTNTTFDPDLIDGVGAGTLCEFGAAGAGTPESANGRGVRLQNSVARPMSGTELGNGPVLSSYFVADAADANGDGVSSTGGVSVNFAVAFPAGGGYAAGELKTGETVTVYFNAGIQ